MTTPSLGDVAAENPRAVAGGNFPPIGTFAGATMADLSSWMADHPVVQSHDDAKAAKLLIDRAKAALDEMESERDAKVRPLNAQVQAINSAYKALHNEDAKKPGTFDKVFAELKTRLAAFLRAEEDKREAEAEAARKAKAEAERIAREAEQREREAVENASVGELGIDIAGATTAADEAFAAYQKASRFATVAARDAHVKIGGGIGNAVSLRTVETLHLDSPIAAIMDIGVTENIRAAILTEARAYRKLHGKLPDGVSATEERKL